MAWAWGQVVMVGPLLLGLMGADPASAAIAGLPQPPTPVPAPVLWVGTGNDNLSDGVLDRDDFRTGTLDVGVLGRHWAAAADSSVLTDRQTQHRLDQITASVGWATCSAEDPGNYLSAGIGLRAWGNFGGQETQNKLHQHTGYKPLDFDYDPVTRIDGLVYVCGRYGLLTETPSGWSLLAPPGRWGLQVSEGALATDNREADLELEADTIYIGAQGSAWLGVRYHDEIGRIPGSTGLAVASRERGWWLMVGTSVNPDNMGIYATIGVDPHSRGALGQVGVQIYERHGQLVHENEAVEEDLGYYSGAVIGYQYRWRPHTFEKLMPTWLSRWVRSEVLVDYRFGGIPRTAWRDLSAFSDQFLLGHSSTLTPPAVAGIELMPYGYGGLGVRIERLQPSGPSPRFPQQQTSRGVAQLGAGVRVATRLANRYPRLHLIDRFRVGAGYDRWFPWRSAAIRQGTDQARYQEPGWSVGAYLGLMLDW